MIAETIEIVFDGRCRLDPKVFGPDQVAFARGMHVEYAEYRWYTERTALGSPDSDIAVFAIVGLWISAFFPLLLSIAISTSWKEPILTLALYGSLEVFTNNVVEPFVLGRSTGMSALAIIVSALFWTWLWSPIGL
jgi:hypothetical protein